ncbi:MAG: pseudaminic acid cytidylyltransferase [Prosthecobacter sp.]|nr:pseudaminic acid cytidylyltransferase [Prosthecobacter sp.]
MSPVPVMLNSDALCIIPARGGSKRIPRKNIRPFLGRPIIAYIIEAALASGCFAEVMVSTDDDEIAAIAEQYGAKVPFRRSPETSNDIAFFPEVLMEVLQEYRKRGREFGFCCGCFATSALTTPEHLREGFEKLRADTSLSYVLPVADFGYPIQRAVRIRSGHLEMFQPENYFRRSQDLEKAYHDAAQWIWMRSNAMFDGIRILSPAANAVVVSSREVQDIDTEEDWLLAELKYRLRQESR